MAPDGRTRPFPVQQMVVLAISRFAEPVASTSVYPYIPEMVGSFNVRTDQIGMYSGWLAAVFSLSQAVTGIAWGRASDKLGRKPMILLALTLIMASSLSFGFSTSLTMAFVTRSVQGASSGNVGIIRTAVAEMVQDKENQPRAFSIMPLVWNIGSIFGPSIGGFLSNPQRRGWFVDVELFKKYPYALPNLTISVFFLIGIASGWLFLRESHEGKKHRKDSGLIVGSLLTSSCRKRKKSYWKRDDDEADPFLGQDGDATTRRTSTTPSRPSIIPSVHHTWADIFSKQSSINLVAYTGLAMHSMAFDQLMPVFMHHPVQSAGSSTSPVPISFTGGFGLESSRIGILFTVYGVFGMLVQLFLFPPLARKLGILNCLKICSSIFPIVYAVIPFTSLLPTTELRQAVCLALMLVKCAAGIFGFPCSTILLTNSAASLGILGTLNGVATSISAIGRGAGPALCGWAFTYGVDIGYIVVPFWTLLIVSSLSAIPVWWLIEMEGPTARKTDRDDYNMSRQVSHEERPLVHGSDPEEEERDTHLGESELGILSGTEAADLLEENIPIAKQSKNDSQLLGRPEFTLYRRSSSYNLNADRARSMDHDE